MPFVPDIFGPFLPSMQHFLFLWSCKLFRERSRLATLSWDTSTKESTSIQVKNLKKHVVLSAYKYYRSREVWQVFMSIWVLWIHIVLMPIRIRSHDESVNDVMMHHWTHIVENTIFVGLRFPPPPADNDPALQMLEWSQGTYSWNLIFFQYSFSTENTSCEINKRASESLSLYLDSDPDLIRAVVPRQIESY